jgi:hypothetical protein
VPMRVQLDVGNGGIERPDLVRMHQGEELAPQELFPIDPQAPGESLEPHMLLVRRPPLPSGGFGYSGRGLHTGFGGAQGRPVSVQRILQVDASVAGLPVPTGPRAASVQVWHPLGHVDGAQGRGDRLRRSIMLPILQAGSCRSRGARTARKGVRLWDLWRVSNTLGAAVPVITPGCSANMGEGIPCVT